MILKSKHLELGKKIKARGIGRGCNDLLTEEIEMLNKSEWVEFCKAYHEWNGDIEEFDPKNPIMYDFMVVGFIEHLVIKHYESTKVEE